MAKFRGSKRTLKVKTLKKKIISCYLAAKILQLLFYQLFPTSTIFDRAPDQFQKERNEQPFLHIRTGLQMLA